jgi:putative aminopeptidase FrvX
MDQEAFHFLRKLIESPSPSGFEAPVQKLIRERLESVADEVRTDVHGNVISVINPGAERRVMLAGHCDEVGFMVQHVTDEGYIYFAAVGGIDAAIVPAQRVVIHNARGPVDGVVGRTAVHLMEKEEREKPRKLHEMWIDIGARDKADALASVDIGDPITFKAGLCEMKNNVLVARGFDDRIGAFVVVEAMRLLKGCKPDAAVYGVSTVQEELGLRGARTSAFGIDPHVGVAVDVGFASDYPTADKNRIGDVKIGGGPILHRGANINHIVGQMLIDTAKANDIPYQMAAEPKATGTDANAMQVNRAGSATGLVSVPNRYMHTPVEICSKDDIDNSSKLLAAFCMEIKADSDFIPK